MTTRASPGGPKALPEASSSAARTDPVHTAAGGSARSRVRGPIGGRIGNGPVTPAFVGGLIASRIVDVPDFPTPGVVFKDLTPFFADGPAFAEVVDALATAHVGAFDLVAGVEARGFVLGSAVAYAAGAGIVPIRKAGKLPRRTHAASYALEYGTATLEVHEDAFPTGARVLVVDDVLATGGTAVAAMELVERAGAHVAGFSVLIELTALGGRARLAGCDLHTLLAV